MTSPAPTPAPDARPSRVPRLALAMGIVVLLGAGALLLWDRGPPRQTDGNCLIECVRKDIGASLDERQPLSAIPKDTQERCARACEVSDHEIRARNRVERERRDHARELSRQATEGKKSAS